MTISAKAVLSGQIIFPFTKALAQMFSTKRLSEKNSQNSQENACVRISFSNKVRYLQSVTLLKKEVAGK